MVKDKRAAAAAVALGTAASITTAFESDSLG